ncbi:ethylene-insensitive protein 2-like isoform X2 [Olea europaea var. sylvestris]|uniref:ethylene-insensitive protein 2-like isoform X2 n=1 Tax=Olea europaea var. sylvestris TaxID=158386 RepID=UPI000C1CE7E2|nr:ethylene-insensitive protein 2-like isoform X2 [Olea europaea var. sylvestris]
MESETLTTNHRSNILQRVLASAVPVVWIAISYVDPGKWAATVEGGARFGFDVVSLMLIFNCVAILCQYLSARIAVVTGRDLTQICSKEYDNITCIFLGVQAEISIIALDLMMVLGTAYGLNAIFGIDLFNCVFLTGIDAILFPFLATLLNSKAKFLSVCLTILILLSYVFGVLISQPESSFSMGGMLTKLSGESAYALMSLLGASIMPHNFYLHSSIVQQDQGPATVSIGALCHDHFIATLCIFSGIFLVNCMLMNLAANVFYSTGLVLLTFQDALSLLDQVEIFKSSIASFFLVLLVFFSNQIMALTWSRGRQVIIHDFFGMDIPGWLHRATIRIIAIIPALYCVWNSGAEGIYQLLIFTQVMVALLLPSSVIPLFRIASSRSVMGAYKVSQPVEFFALVSFIGMLGLKIIFVIEMMFGNSDWVNNLKWSIGGSLPMSYLILLATACVFLCMMLWLATTPLKSASQVLNWEVKFSVPEASAQKDQIEISEAQYQTEKGTEKQVPAVLEKSFGSHQNISVPSPGLSTEMLLDSESNLHLPTIGKNNSEITLSGPSVCSPEASATTGETVMAKPICKVPEDESIDAITFNAESKDTVEKTLTTEASNQNEMDDEGEPLEPDESAKDVSESIQSLTSEGPGSFRSLSGKGDDLGSSSGSLSRLAGLGRAARRQLTAILLEFWGQLFDFHGQATQEAKAKKLDVLLGIDSNVDPKSSFASVKGEGIARESTGYSSTMGGRGSDLRTSSLYSSPLQQIGHGGMESSLGVQQGSPMRSSHMQLFDAYVQSSNHNALDSGERRYYSMHVPASSAVYDQQPVTIHGYQLASYLSQMSKEKDSGYLNAQLESANQKSSPSVKSNYVDSFARPVKHRPQSGLSTIRPPGFHNVPVSRNSSLKSERAFHDLSSPEPVDYTNSSVNVKKYYSLPNRSGLHIPQQDYSVSGNSSQWKNQVGYEQSISRLAPVQTCSSTSSWAGTALGFGELSPSEVRRDAFSLQYASSSGAGSLWSKQPYEQFGVADKSPAKTQESATTIDLEAKLLQSFRSCILKLLKLEGSDWLFRQNDGADEDLIDRVAARERVLYEVETRGSDRKPGSGIKIDETDYMKLLSIPHCGDGCVWRVDLVVSFGVWCIHRILDLSLMESRPELWGKYTYVLNCLQGIIDLAFSKPRSPMAPCFCLQLSVDYQQRSSPPISNGSLPPPPKPGRGKFTTAASLLDVIKDVETAISCRKGRSGTAAGDVAFPKGKINLASVLNRYKRRLSNKPVGYQEVEPGLHKVPQSPSQGL